MKNNLIRFSASLSVAFLFVFILFCYPYSVSNKSVSNEPVAETVRQTLKVSVRISEKEAPVVYSEETCSEETAIAEEHEIIAETYETETFIGSYLDADSATDNLTLPVIDLKRVYSKIVYPASLRRKNIEAEIELRVYVDKDGNIKLQFPDGTENAFISSIEKAFRGIKAKPAIFEGNPADVTFTIPILFKLE